MAIIDSSDLRIVCQFRGIARSALPGIEIDFVCTEGKCEEYWFELRYGGQEVRHQFAHDLIDDSFNDETRRQDLAREVRALFSKT